MAVSRNLGFILSGLAVGALPSLAQAQAQAAEQILPEVRVKASTQSGDGYNPPTTSSGTKIEAPLRDIPQTINVVPQEVLRDTGARSMQDALRMIPGVGLSHGDGQRDQITIRGFTAIADQFIDGLRDDALYFRDLSNIERVEVIKGPASVLYGRGSSGGLINRVTKKPGPDMGEAVFSAGSFSARRAEFDFGKAAGADGPAFRVTGAIEDSGSYRSQQFLKRENIAPSIQFGSASGTGVLLQAEHTVDRRVTDFGIPSFRGRPVDVHASTYYGAANAAQVDYSQSQVDALAGTLTHRFNDSWSVRNAFRNYSYTLDRNNTLTGSVNEAAQTVTLNRTNLRRQEDGFFNQTEFVQKLNTGSVGHKILYGMELGRQTKDQRNVSANAVATVSLFNPVLPVLPLTINAAPSTDNTGVFTTTSFYVQDMVELSGNWKALVGARYDTFEQSTIQRRAGQSGLARTDREWSPRAGLVWQPSLSQSYYASWSQSFQPSGEAFALAANNAQLEPEKTTNHEVGAKIDFFDGLASLTTSLFRLERTNIKVTDPTTNTLIPVGTQRTEGLELTFGGQLPGGWQVYSGYAHLNGRITQSVAVDSGQAVRGKRPTLTPGNTLNLWLAKSLPGGFLVGAGANYVDDRFANPGNTVTLPAHTTLDAVAAYRTKAYDLQLNLYNLTDRKYIVAGHGTNANLNLPGAPRSALLTLRVRF